MSTTQDFPVTGMTCAHCVSAVTEELGAVPGVSAVTVDLQPDGASTVTVIAEQLITDDQVAAALDEAGNYHLASRR